MHIFVLRVTYLVVVPPDSPPFYRAHRVPHYIPPL